MAEDSKYFDKIRIKSVKAGKVKQEKAVCEWEGCTEIGEFRAPKADRAGGGYHNFCLKHVREFNKGYNYFNGMSDSETWDQHKSSQTGERPTWKMGVNGHARNGRKRIFAGSKSFNGFKVRDSHGVLGKEKITGENRGEPKRHRPVRVMERRSLDTLGLDDTATEDTIRIRYKDLLKQHHPDANGGDRSTEDRLREIIQAYKHLKSVGFC